MKKEIVFSESVGRRQFFICKSKNREINKIIIVCEIPVATKFCVWKISRELAETILKRRFYDF